MQVHVQQQDVHVLIGRGIQRATFAQFVDVRLVRLGVHADRRHGQVWLADLEGVNARLRHQHVIHAQLLHARFTRHDLALAINQRLHPHPRAKVVRQRIIAQQVTDGVALHDALRTGVQFRRQRVKAAHPLVVRDQFPQATDGVFAVVLSQRVDQQPLAVNPHAVVFVLRDGPHTQVRRGEQVHHVGGGIFLLREHLRFHPGGGSFIVPVPAHVVQIIAKLDGMVELMRGCGAHQRFGLGVSLKVIFDHQIAVGGPFFHLSRSRVVAQNALRIGVTQHVAVSQGVHQVHVVAGVAAFAAVGGRSRPAKLVHLPLPDRVQFACDGFRIGLGDSIRAAERVVQPEKAGIQRLGRAAEDRASLQHAAIGEIDAHAVQGDRIPRGGPGLRGEGLPGGARPAIQHQRGVKAHQQPEAAGCAVVITCDGDLVAARLLDRILQRGIVVPTAVVIFPQGLDKPAVAQPQVRVQIAGCNLYISIDCLPGLQAHQIEQDYFSIVIHASGELLNARRASLGQGDCRSEGKQANDGRQQGQKTCAHDL